MSRKWFGPIRSCSHQTVSYHWPRGGGFGLESLERREMLTTLTVDVGDSGCAADGDDLYCQIQEAIDAAHEGDEILVEGGNYDPIKINKNNLTVQAAGAAAPIIDGGAVNDPEQPPTVPGIELAASGVTLKGLTVRNVRAAWNVGAILVTGDNNHLDGNTAERNTAHNGIGDPRGGNGFHVSGSNNTLVGNTAQDNTSHGFSVPGANNTLLNNIARRNDTDRTNGGEGFIAWAAVGNEFRGNVAEENRRGFWFVGGDRENTLEGNIARGNRLHGFEFTGSSSDIVIDNVAIGNGCHTGCPQNEVGGYGFAFTSGANFNEMQNNVASANTDVAFFVEQLAENTVHDNQCTEGSDDHSSSAMECTVPLAGDATLDGRFNQLDIVQVLQADRYLSDEPAVWSQGDWNFDGLFDQADIVAALQAGNYLQ